MSALQHLAKRLAYRCGFSLRRLRAPRRVAVAGGPPDPGRIRPLLHRRDPYAGFDFQRFPDDPAGWGSDSPAFAELVAEVRPHRVVEVGTWKGGSALTIARALDAAGLDAEVVCVDTWLGALEMWTDLDDPTRHGALELAHGFPSVYYRFLANVCHAGQQHRITPFPVPSLTAAQWFALHGLQTDLIYLDASHEEEDVYQDLVAWWDILRPGGTLAGDDWAWDGVRLAASRFAADLRLHPAHRHDKWTLHKPA